MPTTAPATPVKKAAPTATRPAAKPAAARATAKKPQQVRAVIRYVHQAPQKVRRIADVVRSLGVVEAEHVLASLPKRATTSVWKAIQSAASNAVHNHGLDKSKLFVASIQVNQSMMLPRFAPRAQGRAYKIRKRFSHVEVAVAERATPTPKREKRVARGAK